MNREVHAFRTYLAEAVGTFALVFAGTGAIVVIDVSAGVVTHEGIACTFGLIVMAVIYAIGDISGAHINPTVTLGFWAAGRFTASYLLPYLASQCIGAVLASLLLRALFLEHDTLGATVPAGPALQSFVLEVVLTFLLMFVILCVAIGATASISFEAKVDAVTAATEAQDLPKQFLVEGTYPNLFQRETTLAFSLPRTATVHVEVLDLLGRSVYTVPAERYGPGSGHRMILRLSGLPSGVYVYRAVAVEENGTRVVSGSLLHIP